MLAQKYKTKGITKTAAALIIIAMAFIKETAFSPAEKSHQTLEANSAVISETDCKEVLLYAEEDSTYSSESTIFSPEKEKTEPAKTDISSFDKNDLKVLNNTSLRPDFWSLLNSELNFEAAVSDEPSVLIIHTHASEAYTPSEKYSYEPTDPSRTEDTDYNMVRIGEEIAAGLTCAGIGVYHERELFDYPSYNGSYTRALERINELLAKYPSIQIVLDIHRDALVAADGTEYAGTCVIDGEKSAEILIVAGSGEGGLNHPEWKENLKFALQLERMMEVKYNGLLRNLNLRTERFNQHLTKGSLIIEVGCTGNTLDEAIVAARAFAACASEVILEAISQSPESD